MSDEAAWKLGKVKYEEPGYVIVRKSKGVGQLRGDLKAGLDGVAGEWIKLNKSDLGSGGAGGGYDDTALWKEIADLNDTIDNLDIPDTADLATKDELAALQNQVTKDIADLKDHLDNHPSGGGDTTQIEEDITKLKESVSDLETALEAVEDGLAQEVLDRQEGDKNLQDQIDVINTSGYDDTKVKEDIQANADAIAEIQTKGYDDTKIREDFAEADQALQDQIDALDSFDPTALQEKDAQQDGRLDQIDEDQKTQDARLAALEAGIDGGGDTGEYLSAVWKKGTSSTAGFFGGSGNLSTDQNFVFNKIDASGGQPDLSLVEEGHTIVAELNGEWGKWEVTANNGLEYGKYQIITKALESSSSANWVSNGEYTFTFADPEAATEIFDPAELVDRLDQIDLDQEAQNDRLDQIDLDQEEQNERLDALEQFTGLPLTYNTLSNYQFINTEGSIYIAIKNPGDQQYVQINKKDVNGKDLPSFEVGDTVNLAADGQQHTYKIGYFSESDQYFIIVGDDDSIPGAFDAKEDGKEATISFGEAAGGGDFDATYLEEKDAEQDARLDALEAEIGGNDIKGYLSSEWQNGQVNNNGYFSASGDISADQGFTFNQTDASGEQPDLSVVEVGHLIVAESKNTGEWGKWEVTVNDGLEYGKHKITAKALESSSDAVWEFNMPYIFTFADPEKQGGDFDATYLEEKDEEQDGRLDQIDEDQKTQNDRLDALEADKMDDLVGIWKQNNNAGTSGGMIGVSNFSNVTSIMLNRRDMSGEPFDFSQLEVGTAFTMQNMFNTDAGGRYKITSLEDKGGHWVIGVDTIEGTGIMNTNYSCEFSFAVPAEPLDTEKLVTVAEGQEGPLSIWRGTKDEYDAIATPSDEVLYIVLP